MLRDGSYEAPRASKHIWISSTSSKLQFCLFEYHCHCVKKRSEELVAKQLCVYIIARVSFLKELKLFVFKIGRMYYSK